MLATLGASQNGKAIDWDVGLSGNESAAKILQVVVVPSI